MAEKEVDRIEINISVNGGDRAQEQVEGLSRSFRSLQKSADGPSAKQSFRNAQTNIEKSTGKIGRLAASLKRIAVYRLLRTIIKDISQGVREGVNNLVLYSAAMNSLDAAKASKTMNEYATTLLYAKNATGAAVMPMLQSLLPALQTLSDWFVAGANAVNQFWSALQGKGTFTRAKKYAIEYNDSLKRATGSAKELKKTIASFDEINLLNGASGGSGGRGAEALDYSQMFEEAEIESRFFKIAKKARSLFDTVIKPAFKWIEDHLEIVKWSALGVLGAIAVHKAWKVAEGIIGFGTGIDEVIKKANAATGGYLQAGVGLILSIVGVELSWRSGYKNGLNGKAFISSITDLAGPALSAIGGAIVGGTFFGMPGVAIGATIGFGVALLVSYIGFKKGQKDRLANSEYVRDVDELRKSIESTLEFTVDVRARIGGITNEIDAGVSAKLEYAKRLISDIFSMDRRQNLTASEIERLKSEIEILNGLGLEGIQVHFDELTGHVVESRGAIEKLIGQLERQYRVEANREAIIALIKEEIRIKDQLKIAEKDLSDARANAEIASFRYKTAQDDLNRAIRDGRANTAQYEAALSLAEAAYQAHTENLLAAESAYSELSAEMEITKSKTKDYCDEQIKLVEAINGGTDAISDFGDVAAKSISSVEKSFSKANLQVGAFYNKLRDVSRAGDISTRVQFSSTSGKISAYASGGFPEDGLFFANHGELVGKFANGKTAVANNDQIISGIASGVSEANEPVVSAIEMLADRVVSAIERKKTGVNIDGRDIRRSVQRAAMSEGGV